MHFRIGIFIFFFVLFQQVAGQVRYNSHLEIDVLLQKLALNGKIRSIEENTFKVVNKNGKALKGEKTFWVPSNRIRDYYVAYNKQHYIIELREPCTNAGGSTAEMRLQKTKTGYAITETLKANCKYETKIVLVYDQQNQLLHKSYFDEGKSFPRIQTVYKYDANGRKVSETDTIYNEQSNQKYVFPCFYEYDKKGRLVVKDETRHEYKTYYNYGTCDSLSTQKKYYRNNKLMEEIVFQYDSLDQKISKTEYRDGKITFDLAYDGKGNILSTKSYGENDSLYSVHTNAYDKYGHRIEETSYNGNMHADYKWVYEYDNSNKLAKETHYDSYGANNGSDTLVTQTVYGYNKNGDVQEIIKTELFGGDATQRQTFEYKYDKHKNWIKKTGYLNVKPIFIQERKIKYFR
jgi:hypothetical protein